MIQQLFRYPVKSMRGEELSRIAVTRRGLEGDRAWALIDSVTGRVVSAKQPRRWAHMLDLAARRGGDGDSTTFVRLPDGRESRTGDPGTDELLTTYLGREVHFSTAVPEEATIDRLDPFVNGQCVLELNDRTETTGVLGQGAPAGTFFDYAPVHLLTTATLRRLSASSPGRRFAVARFRPNLVIDLPESPGFVENGWEGALLHVGQEVVLRVELPTPRCAIPTLAQPGLSYDVGIIRAIAQQNTLVMAGGRRAACIGAYAQVVREGVIRVNDRVRVEPGVT